MDADNLMKVNLLKQGIVMLNSNGIGTVTRKMVRERAVELTLIKGLPPQNVSRSEWNQAMRELTGKGERDATDFILESAPEAERWDPVHGSRGSKANESSSEDEDDDGRSDSARLVEEGISEAAHDQMLKSAVAKPI